MHREKTQKYPQICTPDPRPDSMKKSGRERGGGGRKGFSLVEVTVAIGIVSFSLLALVGVMPVGLAVSQEAIRQTVHAHILQRISSDLGMLPFADLGAYVAAEQYYNWDGQSVTAGGDPTFVVKLECLPPDYPGSDTLGNLDAVMDRVAVKIRRIGQPENAAARTTLTISNSGL